MSSNRYDIVAKAPPDTTRERVLLMFQALLAERFRLKIHRKGREMRVYTLTVARGGDGMKRSSETDGNFTFGSGRIAARGLSMSDFADRLSGAVFKLGVPVLDATGLTGTFDFMLNWAPDDLPDASDPALFTAIQEQLGLRLTPSRSVVQVWIVDSAEKVPAGN